MSDWAVQAETKTEDGKQVMTGRGVLVAPNGEAYVLETEAAAKTIKGEFDQLVRENDALKAEKAEAFLATKEDALLQASAEFLDHFQKRDALMRDKRARSERLA